GLSIDGVDFALALMADQADPTRKFTTLQASADLAAFVGIDAISLAAKDISVTVNQGVTLAATPASSTTINTQLGLTIPGDTVGTLVFTKGGDSVNLALTGTQTNAQIITALRTAIESLDGVGAGNVLVTGTR